MVSDDVIEIDLQVGDFCVVWNDLIGCQEDLDVSKKRESNNAYPEINKKSI